MTYKTLPPILFSEDMPTKVIDPKLILFNESLAKELGLELDTWQDEQLLAGNKLPSHFTPIAQAYFGHQFGHLAILGDGRAILLAEVVTPENERFDIQLKGSGPTIYSRRGDGRAALGPMLREYLVSEYMHAVKIPTTRSLAVVTTGETIRREKPLTGAILTRVAASHIRVGTFQFAYHEGVVKELADYTIQRHFPELSDSDSPYLGLLQAVINRQANLIAQWMAIGFIHGVMNTDNMALSGETIDYGPCAFLDVYNSNQVFSSIDHGGRYRYSQQPAIAKWNLARLAETLLELIDLDQEKAIEHVVSVLNTFDDTYQQAWLSLMGKKLGREQTNASDYPMIISFLELLEEEALDYTNTFLHLTFEPDASPFTTEKGLDWHKAWRKKITKDSLSLMRETNPRLIPRNQILDDALTQAEAGNRKPLIDLLQVIQQPFIDPPKEYQEPSKNSSFVTYCGT